jgi:hypothetical protein
MMCLKSLKSLTRFCIFKYLLVLLLSPCLLYPHFFTVFFFFFYCMAYCLFVSLRLGSRRDRMRDRIG